MVSSSYTFPNDAGQDVFVRVWLPSEPPRGVVVLAHGMAEHGGRYERFAAQLTHAGYAVSAPDLRSHGRTAAGKLGVGGPDAWHGMLRDVAAVCDRATSEHGGLPLFLFGHSMGSMLAQRFAQLHGARLRGLILSGTTSAVEGGDALVSAARAAAAGDTANEPSALAVQIFGGFNAAFEPAKTPFDWLSRDEAEVAAYLADPSCGFALSNATIADVLAGFLEGWIPENERGIPQALPILNFAGELDPVGAAAGLVTALGERYASYGIEHVETVLYPRARHEMLNETNRDDVHADVLSWLAALTP